MVLTEMPIGRGVPGETTDAAVQKIREQILKSAELLPSQGPITGFAFLNPLKGLEHLPMPEALKLVQARFHCEPYLAESQYRKHLASGRITIAGLSQVVMDDLKSSADLTVADLCTRRELRFSMLQYPLNFGDERELEWVVAETDALKFFRPEVTPITREQLVAETRHWVMNESVAGRELCPVRRFFENDDVDGEWERTCLKLLWASVMEGLKNVVSTTSDLQGEVADSIPTRPTELIKRLYQFDCDQLVHPVLITFCAAFVDQGYAHWRLPNRDAGFFAAFETYVSSSTTIGKRWMKGVAEELERVRMSGLSALHSIHESLQLLGIAVEEQATFLSDSVLALRGFSGMLWQNEVRGDRVHIPSPVDTLIEFVAVRLILDRFAAKYALFNEIGLNQPLSEVRSGLQERLRGEPPKRRTEQLAYTIFQLAQIHGWSPQQLTEMSAIRWQQLTDEVTSFTSLERRRILHAAFERKLMHHVLDAIAVRAAKPKEGPDVPSLQVFCCIDAREESFRRHIEEIDPSVETFGTAGFYGIPMYYRSASDAHFSALCPIVIKPKHWVVEDVVYALEESHKTRARMRRAIGEASHRLHTGSRTSLAGAFVSTLLGPLATVPLLSRILFPRLTAKMQKTARQFVAQPAITRLRLERNEEFEPGPDDEHVGFTLEEMCGMAERALRDIGLTSRFAPLVVILGHGSSCLNNPHESAYHCGACSGSAGGPNARALAVMLNDPRIRRRLAENGLEIPEDTWFVGGLHNTATEEITFYDLELIPTRRVGSLRAARELLTQVAERNAHERCRRFESASLELSPFAALQHAQDRTENLAQTRPEYGNGTNAMCFVGRRSRIRGLYLDRRSFLMSYDSTQDTAESDILARILGAVVPVCSDINLLYTFSAIDPLGWGSGSKLPHNVTSLLGVMDGAASDLRPGLPWQGVDIHEPVRLLFVMETRPEVMLKIMDNNATIARVLQNGWAQVATLDPDTAEIHYFQDGEFVPYSPHQTTLPSVAQSSDWYRGNRDNLPFALIGKPAQQ